MKNILLLTNFSETSQKAILAFVKIYLKNIKETFHFKLLNAYAQPKTGQAQLAKFDDVLRKFSLQDLQIEYEGLKKLKGGNKLDIEIISKNGDLVDAVELIHTKTPIELIVMGTKGSNLFKELLLGSETDRLVRLTKNPVLVIPESKEFVIPKKIVFATSQKECRNKEEFKKLIGIVKIFGSELIILNVFKDQLPASIHFEEPIKKELSGINYSFEYMQNSDEAEGIDKYIHQNQIGLLALIDHRVSMLSKLFRNSVTGKFASRAEVPLLIIHE